MVKLLYKTKSRDNKPNLPKIGDCLEI